jgi:hypothetical protein
VHAELAALVPELRSECRQWKAAESDGIQ